jgi:hypothetical protein
MPEYFQALIKQYCGAVGNEQAERYARAVIGAWYHSLSSTDRQQLVESLPEYLRPKSQLFFHKRVSEPEGVQMELIRERLSAELQKTDQVEVNQVLTGFFRSLKVISEPAQKFHYSELLDRDLKQLFIEA